jgi:Transcriptional regulator PadR-like family
MFGEAHSGRVSLSRGVRARDRFGGLWNRSAGGLSDRMIEGALMRLSEQGLLEDLWQDAERPGLPPRHAYRLTAAGVGRWNVTEQTSGRPSACLDAFRAAPKGRWVPSPPMASATGRERADAIGDVHAETSCLEVFRQALETCKSFAARFAVPPIPLVLLGARAEQGWAIGHLQEAPKARRRR